MALTEFEKILIQILCSFLLSGFCFTLGFLLGAGANVDSKKDEEFDIEELLENE